MTCHNCRSECRKFGKRKDRQRYQCLQCRKVITDTRDNNLGGMYTPVDKAEQVLPGIILPKSLLARAGGPLRWQCARQPSLFPDRQVHRRQGHVRRRPEPGRPPCNAIDAVV